MPARKDSIEYRGLGFSGSTNGLVRAHVPRAAKPWPEGGTGRHSHGVVFQMIYVLKGWITMEQDEKRRTGNGPARARPLAGAPGPGANRIRKPESRV